MDCPCRKPKPGMLELAARDFSIDTSRSLMIGDTWRDMVCAQQFGILGLGVKGGGGFPYAANREEARHQPKQLFEGPLEAVNWWLEQKTPSVS
jgi:D-glycero-D-manno-heptose 1,7-bisphosphate phosphatase